jgi:hypothetical protein
MKRAAILLAKKPFVARCVLTLLLVCLLGACQQTRFEALPSGALSDCDNAWVGAWRIEVSTESKDEDEGPVYWLVDEKCARYQTLETDRELEQENEYTLRYVQQGAQHYLVASKPGSDGDDSAWDKGFMLFRYELRGDDEIRAYEIDNQRVAHLIVDGAIAGRSEVKSETEKDGKTKLDSIENMIAGPTSATDAVIRRKGVFKRKPWLLLRRASDSEIAKVKAQIEDRRNPESG